MEGHAVLVQLSTVVSLKDRAQAVEGAEPAHQAPVVVGFNIARVTGPSLTWSSGCCRTLWSL